MLGNIKKGKITTIIGIVFLLVSTTLFASSIWGNEVDSMLLLIGTGLGIGLLLSPDDLFKKLKDKL